MRIAPNRILILAMVGRMGASGTTVVDGGKLWDAMRRTESCGRRQESGMHLPSFCLCITRLRHPPLTKSGYKKKSASFPTRLRLGFVVVSWISPCVFLIVNVVKIFIDTNWAYWVY